MPTDKETTKHITDSINKYLTSAMGEHWDDEWNTDFFTWAGFGVLFTWTKEQTWWAAFRQLNDDYLFSTDIKEELINPEYFAITVYTFLKENNNDTRVS